MSQSPQSRQPTHPAWTPDPIPTPWDDLLQNITSPNDWHQKRPAIKQRFRDLLRDDARPPIPRDLQLQIHAQWSAQNFTIQRISYNVEPDERAHAYLAIPPGPVPPTGFPAVLCIHGTTDWGARQTLGLPPEPDQPHANTALRGRDFARTLVNSGFVTLSPEHFCCATRRPAEGPFDTAAFYRKHPRWSAIGKSTFENHIALNLLQSLPFVNPRKLAATGHSLGGHNSLFIAAYDDRIQCTLPNCSAPTLNQNPEPLHWSRDHWYIYIPQIREQLLRGQRISCDFHEIMALIAPRPLLEIFALNDNHSASQSHRALLHLKLAELYRLLGHAPAHAFLTHGDAHSYPDLSRSAMLSWMNRWLKHDGDPLAASNTAPTPSA